MTKEGRKYIFVLGGVMSSVGKGIATASIGTLLQGKGFKVTAVKIDPYVNVDAGTMNPTEHGEVFVLNDGMECDQDMGNYERFLERDLSRLNYMTTGSIYLQVIQRERNLEYKGNCVHVVPDIPLAVIDQIQRCADATESEIILIEVGGTVGDYQNILFLEAARLLKFKHPGDVLLALVSHVPMLGVGGNEPKTKPTQHAIHFLNSSGLHPDLVIARSATAIDDKRKEKLEYMCGLSKDSVIAAPDVDFVYDVPINFEEDHISEFILKKLQLKARAKNGLTKWKNFSKRVHGITKTVEIGIVGKYFGTGGFTLSDSYISVIEATKYACWANNVKPVFTWIDSGAYEKNPKKVTELERFAGIIVPGGFGARGIEGLISAIQFVREKKIPYLGLCYGMQLMVIEYARHVAGLAGAHTTEIKKDCTDPVVAIMESQKQNVEGSHYGGTMRLGAYPCYLKRRTIARGAYKKELVDERHRHRYEINPAYIKQLEKAGLVFSGTSPDGVLMEIAELPRSAHPFMLGTQFHPEFQARPLSPHPLFTEFLKAASARKKK